MAEETCGIINICTNRSSVFVFVSLQTSSVAHEYQEIINEQSSVQFLLGLQLWGGGGRLTENHLFQM